MAKRKQKGLRQIKTGSKFCWLAKQDKNGWALGFALNKETLWIRGVRFSSRKEVERALEGKKRAVVFIHLKDPKVQ